MSRKDSGGFWGRTCARLQEKLLAYKRLVKELEKENKTLTKERDEFVDLVKGAHDYLKSTYDLPTWKDEPEYAMMKSFEQALQKK